MSDKAKAWDFAAANRVKRFLPAIMVVLGAVHFLSCPRSMIHAAITWSGDVSPANPSVYTPGIGLYVGQTSVGTITVNGGSNMYSWSSGLGKMPGSNGTVTISGAGSTWTNFYGLTVGQNGTGTLSIQAGGQVSNDISYIGCYSGSIGSVTVSGSGSKWTNTSDLYVGYSGSGTLTVDNGGSVAVSGTLYTPLDKLLGDGSITTNGLILGGNLSFDAAHGPDQTVTFGTGGRLILNLNASFPLGVGYKGNGNLSISEGVTVASSRGYVGYSAGSTSIATVAGPGSKWTNTGSLDIGNEGNGTLNVQAGGQVSNSTGTLGWNANGTATVTGPDSKWTNAGNLYVGHTGNGTLNIEAGGHVSNNSAYLGYNSGFTGTVMVTGAGSTWTNNGGLYVGTAGNGTLTVANGGAVTITGTLYAPLSSLLGDGTITAQGAVLDHNLLFDGTHGSQQTILFGTGGSLNLNLDPSKKLGVGYKGAGTLRIEGGVSITSSSGELGDYSGAVGVATVSGTGSKWINSGDLSIGSSGSGTLNVGGGATRGGLAAARTLSLAFFGGSSGTCNINNGGTLQVQSITAGKGTVNLNWNDGIIQNYDANTDLTFSSFNLILKLAATGTHAFNIDSGRTGTVNAVLANATTQGTLAKTGAGLLTLSGMNTYSGATVVEDGTLNYTAVTAMTSGPYTVNGGTLDIGSFSKSIGAFRITGGTVKGTGTLTSNATYDAQAGTVNARLAGAVGLNKTGAGVVTLTGTNTYSGATAIDEGRFKVTGTILNTSGVTVEAAGTLELAKVSGSATAANLAFGNEGLLLVSAGSQKAGAITGSGITQVDAGASLTAVSIVQDSLIIGSVGAGASGMDEAAAMSQVPEPGTLALLLAGILGGLVSIWRGRERA